MALKSFFDIFQPIDESKEDFRMFLAKNGVLDSLTKALSKIQENQPENPMEVSRFAKIPLPLRKNSFVRFFAVSPRKSRRVARPEG